jgi:hypothetical protein
MDLGQIRDAAGGKEKAMTARALILILAALLIAAVISVYVSRPSYSLVVIGAEPLLIQVGPFATREACEKARQQILTTISPEASASAERVSSRMVCLSSR